MQENHQGDNPPQSTAAEDWPENAGQKSPDLNSSKHKVNIFVGKGKLEVAILLILILAVGGGAFYFGRSSKHVQSSAQKTVQVAVASDSAGSNTEKLPTATFLSGNTYLDSPRKMSGLNFLKNYQALGCDKDCSSSDFDVSYYQIGSTSTGNKIIVMTYFAGPGGDQYLYAIQDGDTYDVLAQNSYEPQYFASDWQASLSSQTTIDYKTKLNDINMPLQLTINNQKMKVQAAPDGAKELPMDSMSLMENGLTSIRGGFLGEVSDSAVKKLGSQNGIDYYEVTANDTANYSVMEYYGAYKHLFSGSYVPAGEIASTDGNLSIRWTSGVNNSSPYFSAGQGCGSDGYVVAKNINPAQLIKVGTTPHGQTVYQLPASSPLVQETYKKDYDSGQYLDNKDLENLSIDQFTKQHAYFLAKNGLGEYEVFLRDDMIVHGGCAKPVIYLYPRQKQQVSVEVGAKIVNSDPTYDSGWQNVISYPDGSLVYKGKVYSSLFWDGYGDGSYPQVNSGSIVKTSEAVDTVKSQLRQQGLSDQEISDFLAYWQPKLQAVKQPYTRLTWFNTSQMNRLAPLDISPQPQTLIRVFLDFQGLDKPYKLQPQHFAALQRQGFTVVEWGGLARNGLDR